MLGTEGRIPFPPPSDQDDEEIIFLTRLENPTTRDTTISAFIQENSIFYSLFQANFLKAAHFLAQINYPLNLNQTDRLGRPFFYHVCDEGDVNWLLWLIEQAYQGEVDLFSHSRTRQNMYHACAHIKDLVFLNTICALHGSETFLFQMSKADQNPLMMAIEYDNALFFEFYLHHLQKETLAFKDTEQRNIVHLIAQHNARKCFITLKQTISESDLAMLSCATDVYQKTPIMVAQENLQVVFELMMGYRDNSEIASLKWLSALALVRQQLTAGASTPEEVTGIHWPIELYDTFQNAFARTLTINRKAEENNTVTDQEDHLTIETEWAFELNAKGRFS